MVFSSISFLFFFLPCLAILHFALRGNTIRNILLLIASLLFYAWGEPVYILLLLVSVLANWLFSLRIAQKENARLPLALAVVFNIGLLMVFKYSGFLVESVNAVLSTRIPVPQIRLPIGISFFTFQALSYVIDVYRDRTQVQKNFFSLLLYISFFPQLIAGPIVKYHDVAEQLSHRQITADGLAYGIKRFLYGLGKKVLLSNTLAVFVDRVFDGAATDLTAPLAWLAAVAYTLQIYYDFSGYSDMAIGLGHIFGFSFKENFDYPYSAVGVKDFWRKWHMSLSGWFREYLYIPLGGNRRGKGRTLLNQLIVWTATGLWHGANVTFVLWGLWNGLFVITESRDRALTTRLTRSPIGRMAVRVYTLLVVVLGFVLFRADTIGYAAAFLKTMFLGGDGIPAAAVTAGLTPWFVFVTVVAATFSFPLLPALGQRLSRTPTGEKTVQIASMLFSVVLLLLSVGALAADTYNPFIYFRF